MPSPDRGQASWWRTVNQSTSRLSIRDNKSYKFVSHANEQRYVSRSYHEVCLATVCVTMLMFKLIVHLVAVIAATSACAVDLCSREYSLVIANQQRNQAQSLRNSNSRRPTRPQAQRRSFSTIDYCHLLDNYNQCMRALPKSCRGDLAYHTVFSLIRQWQERHRCPPPGQAAQRPTVKPSRAASRKNGKKRSRKLSNTTVNPSPDHNQIHVNHRKFSDKVISSATGTYVSLMTVTCALCVSFSQSNLFL